jgi:hypothetical protein
MRKAPGLGCHGMQTILTSAIFLIGGGFLLGNCMRLLMLFIVLGGGAVLAQGEGEVETGQLLGKVRKAQGREARNLLSQLIKRIAVEKKPTTPAELEAVAAEVIRVSQSQKDIQNLFGEGKEKSVARQIGYGSYREQWIFEHPSLTVVFDCIKGREPKVLTVLVSPGEN